MADNSVLLLPALSGDGRRAAVMWIDPSFTKGAVRFFDLQSGKLVQQWNQMLRMRLAMRPDGKVLASVRDRPASITLWDIPTGKALSTRSWPNPAQQDRVIVDMRLSFSPDGVYLAGSSAFGDSELLLWDVHDPTHPRALVANAPGAPAGPPGFAGSKSAPWASAFAFNSRGNALAYVAGEKEIRIWEIQSAKQLSEITLPAAVSGPLAFGNKDQLLALGAPITGGVPAVGQGRVLVWDLSRNKEQARLDLGAGQAALALAHAWDLEAKGWAQGKKLKPPKSKNFPDMNWWLSGAFGPNGHLLLAGIEDRRLEVWDAATNKMLWQAPGTYRRQGFLSPDGRWLAELPVLGEGPPSRPIEIWELPQGRKAVELPSTVSATISRSFRTALSPAQPVGDGRFSPDGRWLAMTTVAPAQGENSAARADTGVTLFKLPTGEHRLLASGPLGWSFAYAFSPDSKLLAISPQALGKGGGSVQLWDVETGEELFRWNTQSTSVVHLAFTPDGASLASCDAQSGVLQVLNVNRLRTRLAEIGLDW